MVLSASPRMKTAAGCWFNGDGGVGAACGGVQEMGESKRLPTFIPQQLHLTVSSPGFSHPFCREESSGDGGVQSVAMTVVVPEVVVGDWDREMLLVLVPRQGPRWSGEDNGYTCHLMEHPAGEIVDMHQYCRW